MKWLIGFSLLCLAATGAASSLPSCNVDRILVEKHQRRLVLLADGEEVRVYRIALGANWEGPKERQGDLRTPEGVYVISGRKPDSRFHRALRISYPSPEDRARAKALGVPPGGDIMIHGLPKKRSEIAELHPEFNWTQGCIAVTNEEIEEIWELVRDGTVVEIRP